MGWLLPAITINTVLALIIASLYLFLYANYKECYMRSWLVSWVCHFLRHVFLLFLMLKIGQPSYWQLLSSLISFLSAIFLLKGGMEFLGRKNRCINCAVLVGVVWIIIAHVFKFSFMVSVLPIFIYVGVVYIRIGWLFLIDLEYKTLTAKIVGTSFILWGLHKFDYPFLRDVKTFAPYGFGIGAFFTIVIAFGLLFLFFKNLHTKLRNSEVYNRKLFQLSRTGLAVFDLSGTIVDANQAFLKLVGYTLDELKELAYWDLTPKEYDIQQREEIEKYYVTGNLGPFEKEYIKKNGHRVPISVSGTQLFFQDKEYIWASVEDISERKRVEDELKHNIDLANSANQAKSDFLAMMSHEIRTPMNAIIGMAEVLQDETLLVHQKNCVDVIKKNGEFLTSLIGDILDLTKVEEDKVSFDVQEFDISECCQFVMSLFTSLSKEKNILLNYDESNLSSSFFWGDEARFRQILVNLVGNAIKFTDEGEVSITIFDDTNVKGESIIQVDIADTGIGIQQESLDKIFEKFSQADSRIERKYGGTGLGLTLAKHLVEKMGGMISVRNRETKGTLFSLVFPFKKGSGHSVYHLAKPDLICREKLSEYPLKILLAEDSVDNVFVIKSLLGRTNWKVDVASDGRKAVDMFVENKYDIILMDLQMPLLNGFDAVKEIRNLESEESAVPVIALSALALKDDIEKSIEVGCDAHLTKPVSKEKLFKVITHWATIKNPKILER